MTTETSTKATSTTATDPTTSSAVPHILSIIAGTAVAWLTAKGLPASLSTPVTTLITGAIASAFGSLVHWIQAKLTS
jgi:hypothetical protein